MLRRQAIEMARLSALWAVLNLYQKWELIKYLESRLREISEKESSHVREG